jgi:thiol-disulfide isomerase/thioredoxin
MVPMLVAGVALSAACSGASGPGSGAPVAKASSTSGGESAEPARNVSLDFSLPAVDGSSVDLKQFDGTIRVVDFWATWCPPCREAIPHLNELHQKFKDRGVTVMGISVDENPKVLAGFARETPIKYTSLMTSEKAEAAFGGIVGLPTTFVLDRQGKVYRTYVGEVDMTALEKDVETLISAG